MSAITYKCPNCPSSLKLDPETQRFTCDYCHSSFTLDELKKQAANRNDLKEEFSANAKLYHCQGCGAEVFSDDTTAATFCIYCHSPVVLSGALSGALRPDIVIPFKVAKENVVEALMGWCRKKRFIDPAFFDQAQVEKLSGVYFPFFVVDGQTNGKLNRQGTKVKTWMQGNYRYTQTDTYRIEREGEVAFEDITVNALNKDHTYLLNGIQPYDQRKAVPFSMPYLSGFLADKRNIEKADALPEVEGTAKRVTSTLLNDTITGYTSLGSSNESIHVTKTSFSYALMPAWMLTYRYGEEPFFFAMNGDSGKIAGRVPLSKNKLFSFAALMGAAVLALLMIAGWLL